MKHARVMEIRRNGTSMPCISNWVPRNRTVPQRCVRGSERRKCVMAEGFLLSVLNLCVRIKILWRHSTLIIPSLTARRQSIAASIQRLPDAVVKSLSTVGRRQESMCHAKRSGYRSV